MCMSYAVQSIADYSSTTVETNIKIINTIGTSEPIKVSSCQDCS